MSIETWEARFRAALASEFDQRKHRNKNYSLRAFARNLRLSTTTVSEFLQARRNISPKLAFRICEHCDFDKALRSQVETARHEKQKKRPIKHSRILPRQDFVLSAWEYFAILSALDCKKRLKSIEDIQSVVNVPMARLRLAMPALLKAGVVVASKRGYQRSGKHLTTPNGVPSPSVRDSHRESCGLAAASLEHWPVNLRDFSHVTMAIDPDRLEEAGRMLRTFRSRLVRYLEGGDRRQVYRLNLQLFPLGEPSKPK